MYKKFLSYLVISSYIAFSYSFIIINAESNNQANLETSAASAVLISACDSNIIYAKNENEKRSMASTTKIMTALISLEEANIDDKKVKITDEMVRIEGSSMGLMPGNVITISNMVKGMMMCSGNDAANSLAISIAGSPAKFAERMNEKASQIGMKNTHFVTPSGLDSDEHYSTSYDMAILGAYAMENPNFRNIVAQKHMKVNFIEPDEIHCYKNHNRLLSLYDSCTGIKTGFTKKSGRCLVSCAEKNGVRLVAVTLNDGDDWRDHQKMFDYGFSMLSSIKLDDSTIKLSIPVVGGISDETNIIGGNSTELTILNKDVDKIERTIEMPNFLYAPLCKGQIVGKVIYKIDDKVVATNDLIVQEDNKLFIKDSIISKICYFLSNLFNKNRC